MQNGLLSLMYLQSTEQFILLIWTKGQTLGLKQTKYFINTIHVHSYIVTKLMRTDDKVNIQFNDACRSFLMDV